MSRGQKSNQSNRTRKPGEPDEELQVRLDYGKIAESPYFELVYLVKLACDLERCFNGMTEAESAMERTVKLASEKLVKAVFAAVKGNDDKFFPEFGKILRIICERDGAHADPVGMTILQLHKYLSYRLRRPPTMGELLRECRDNREEFDEMEESQFRRTVQKELRLQVTLERDVRVSAPRRTHLRRLLQGESVDVYEWPVPETRIVG